MMAYGWEVELGIDHKKVPTNAKKDLEDRSGWITKGQTEWASVSISTSFLFQTRHVYKCLAKIFCRLPKAQPMSLGQDQAREGTAPTVQTPHCSTTPHTASYTEPLHSQGKDEEGSSLWGINRLEYGLTVKAAVGKILACCRTSVR